MIAEETASNPPPATDDADGERTPPRWVGGLRLGAPPLITALLLGLAVWVIHGQLRDIHYRLVEEAFEALPARAIFLAILATAGSFLTLTGYDWSALRYVGVKVPWSTLSFASFTSYALGNTTGFGILTAGSVRYRVYSAAGLSLPDIARVTLFCALAFGFGITVVGASAALLEPDSAARLLRLPPDSVAIGALLLLGAAAAFILVCFLHRGTLRLGPFSISLPSGEVALAQLAISALDICLTAAVFYALLPGGGPGFGMVLAVFAIALLGGVVSHVPAGLGVFEAVMLIGLEGSLPVDTLTAALFAYRIIYHLLPLMVAAALLGGGEILRTSRGTLAFALTRNLGTWTSRLAPPFVATLTFLGGVMLLFSAATPTTHARLALIEPWIPLPALEISHFVGSIAGLVLLIVSRGLYKRLDAAYWITVVVLSGNVVLALLKGGAVREALVLLVILGILAACRREFYRPSSLLDQPLNLTWAIAFVLALGGMIWLVFFSFRHVEYSRELWWQFEIQSQAPRAMRATLGVVLAGLAFGLLRLLRPAPIAFRLPDKAELDRARAVIQAQDRADANLALLGDKALLFSDSGRAFLMYGVRGRSWVALGDPVGPDEERNELIWRFLELADRHNARAAFYQIRADDLPLYIDAGLVLLKLGEEARVPLAAFSLEGSARSDLRRTVSRSERDGLSVEVLPGGQAAPLMDELSAISDAWLEARNTREKRFSLGFFSPAYVGQFDTALVRFDGRIIAFATILATDTKAEALVDLMRHLPEAPGTTMKYLFVKLLLHYKAEGYRTFSLSMVPLAGMEAHPLAPRWHRFGRFLYAHGEHFYNFQGLRQFKQKFDPEWAPRYLAMPQGANALVLASDIAALCGGGLKGVVSK
ncbi:MAG: bifunctional lysylphosphatidylglycerol flippase/synthetase MprF [Pseudomonadota bacterium]